MAIMEILHFPDPRLREKASTVDHIDEAVLKLIDDMLETMYAAPGVGLAATQVGVHKRIAVLDVSEEKNQPCVLINPEMLSMDGEAKLQEGCLSVPGHYDTVTRAERCRVRAMGRDGKLFELDGEELLAQCLQHELDHLDGKLYIDQLSELKRGRIRRKLRKESRQSERE